MAERSRSSFGVGRAETGESYDAAESYDATEGYDAAVTAMLARPSVRQAPLLRRTKRSAGA